jgi:hypothetical protein
VEPEIVQGLRDRRIEDHWPVAKAGWLDVRETRDGKALYFLRQVDGHCVFLLPDRRCAVHSLFGAAAKPGFCREFPFHFVRDPQGISAIVRAECGGFHRSSADGPEVTQDELQAALDLERVVPRRTFAPEQVKVFGRKIPLDHWLEIEQEALARLEEVPSVSPGAALVVLRSVLAEGVNAPLPLPDPRLATDAANGLLDTVQQVLRQVLASPGGPPDRVAFVQDTVGWLEAYRDLIAVPFAPLDPELRRYLHLLLRSALVARTWQPLGAVDVGLGAFALGVVVGVACGGTTVETFDHAYRDWSKLAANALIGMVLARAPQPLSDLFVHLT